MPTIFNKIEHKITHRETAVLENNNKSIPNANKATPIHKKAIPIFLVGEELLLIRYILLFH